MVCAGKWLADTDDCFWGSLYGCLEGEGGEPVSGMRVASGAWISAGSAAESGDFLFSGRGSSAGAAAVGVVPVPDAGPGRHQTPVRFGRDHGGRDGSVLYFLFVYSGGHIIAGLSDYLW